jgi:hypothetical protein
VGERLNDYTLIVFACNRLGVFGERFTTEMCPFWGCKCVHFLSCSLIDFENPNSHKLCLTWIMAYQNGIFGAVN